MKKIIAALAAIVMVLVLVASPVTAGNEDKVTICHAAGLEGTTHYIELTIGYEAVYGPAGHFYENGTPRAGHEEDYLGPCQTSETPSPSMTTPTPTPTPPSSTPTPTPVASAEPTPTPSVGESTQPTLTPTTSPTPNQPRATLPPTDTAEAVGSTSSLPVYFIIGLVFGFAIMTLILRGFRR